MCGLDEQMVLNQRNLGEFVDREKRRKETRAFSGWPLITLLGKNPESALLPVLVLEPKKCLVLYTTDSDPKKNGKAAKVLDEIKRICGVRNVRRKKLGRPLYKSAAEAVSGFGERNYFGKIIVDVTPGPKDVSIAILQALNPLDPIPVFLCCSPWDDYLKQRNGKVPSLVWLQSKDLRVLGWLPSRKNVDWRDSGAQLVQRLKPRLVRVDCVADGVIDLGGNPGSIIRRIVGPFLRDIVCKKKGGICNRCEFFPSCSYANLYEPPRNDKNLTGGIPRQRMAVFRWNGGINKRVFPGMGFSIEILFFGRLRDAAGWVVLATEEAGKRGIGKNRAGFRVSRAAIVSNDGKEIPLYMGNALREMEDYGETPPMPEKKGKYEKIIIEFVSPTRIISQGSISSRVPFELLIRAILRRYIDLYEGVNGNKPNWSTVEILEKTKGVGVLEEWFDFQDGRHWSSRQKRAVPEGGIVGSVKYQGNILPFSGLLAAGEFFHIGKGTLSGFGRYKMNLSD